MKPLSLCLPIAVLPMYPPSIQPSPFSPFHPPQEGRETLVPAEPELLRRRNGKGLTLARLAGRPLRHLHHVRPLARSAPLELVTADAVPRALVRALAALGTLATGGAAARRAARGGGGRGGVTARGRAAALGGGRGTTGRSATRGLRARGTSLPSGRALRGRATRSTRLLRRIGDRCGPAPAGRGRVRYEDPAGTVKKV